MSRCVASESGGGIAVVSDGSTITMIDSLYDQCHAQGGDDSCWEGPWSCDGGGAVFSKGAPPHPVRPAAAAAAMYASTTSRPRSPAAATHRFLQLFTHPALTAVAASTDLVVTGTNFVGCTGMNGGAISALKPAHITVSASTFDSTVAAAKGGSVFLYDGDSFLTIRSSHFLSSVAGSLGGAIFMDGWSTIDVATSVFRSCLVAYYDVWQYGGFGGAIAAYVGGVVMVSDSAFDGCEASGGGGAMGFVCDGTWAYGSVQLDVARTNFTNNRARSGGAVQVCTAETASRHSATFTDSNFAANEAIHFGGAIFTDRAGGISLSRNLGLRSPVHYHSTYPLTEPLDLQIWWCEARRSWDASPQLSTLVGAAPSARGASAALLS